MFNLSGRIIIFIGPEGSGKTTNAKRLAKETGKLYLTTGDMVRDLARSDEGELGEECRATLSEHRYVDGKLMPRILLKRFQQEDTKDGFILDGGLRTLEETKDFMITLEKADREMPVTVIHLEIPEEISLERLVYGEDARLRVDDTMEGVKSRLANYNNKLKERLAVIANQSGWRLEVVDATPPEEAVYQAVCEAITRGW